VIDSVNGHRPTSGIVVLPITIAPASAALRTTSASAAARALTAAGAAARDLAGEVDLVLDRDRHAQQRRALPTGPAVVGAVRLGQRG
jgi:hypothetical protein